MAALSAALQNLRPQSPFVDLRLMAPQFPPQGALPADALPDSVCRFIALRGVLDDLQSRVRYLQTEATFLERDANSLWNAWKGVFGVRRAFLRSSVAAAAEGVVEQRLQSRLFALCGAGSRVSASAQGLSEKLMKVDERWLTASRLLATSSEEDAARGADEIGEIWARLSKLADASNALDGDVRQGQGELDRLYPRIVESVQRAVPNAVAMPEPWHWTYMVSGKPRPALHYDFELRYDQELENARRDMARRASRRGARGGHEK